MRLPTSAESNHQDACQLKKRSYHLHRDYAFYFTNTINVEKMKENVVFIGETEDYANDLKRLCKIIGIKNTTSPKPKEFIQSRKEVRIKPKSDFYHSFFVTEYLLYNKLRRLKNFHV